MSFNIYEYGFKPIRDAVDRAISIVDDARHGKRIVFPTAWPRLNKQLLGGLQPGKLYIIAGRPGTGKSAFSNQMIFDMLNIATAAGRKVIVLYWSFEMPSWQQIMRTGSSLTKTGMSKLLSVDVALQDISFLHFCKQVSPYRNYPIYFNDKAKDMDFVVKVNKKIYESKPELTIINLFDHSRLFRGDNDELKKLIEVSQGCMYLQSEIECIDILLSQLNRNIEAEHRAKNQYQPLLSDLFGSDSIGQDAHAVMMINRPYDMYGITEPYCKQNPKNLLALHINKNRDGMLGMIPFDSDLSVFTITERVRVDDSQQIKLDLTKDG